MHPNEMPDCRRPTGPWSLTAPRNRPVHRHPQPSLCILLVDQYRSVQALLKPYTAIGRRQLRLRSCSQGFLAGDFPGLVGTVLFFDEYHEALVTRPQPAKTKTVAKKKVQCFFVSRFGPSQPLSICNIRTKEKPSNVEKAV